MSLTYTTESPRMHGLFTCGLGPPFFAEVMYDNHAAH